ncbi:hypothetical protein ACJX0J_024328, partial [Zea mays]
FFLGLIGFVVAVVRVQGGRYLRAQGQILLLLAEELLMSDSTIKFFFHNSCLKREDIMPMDLRGDILLLRTPLIIFSPSKWVIRLCLYLYFEALVFINILLKFFACLLPAIGFHVTTLAGA